MQAIKEDSRESKKKAEVKEQAMRATNLGVSRGCSEAGCLIKAGERYQEHIGMSRIDLLEDWEDPASGERYSCCRTTVYGPSTWGERCVIGATTAYDAPGASSSSLGPMERRSAKRFFRSKAASSPTKSSAVSPRRICRSNMCASLHLMPPYAFSSHGFRGYDTANCLFFLSTGELAYIVAALVVVQNLETGEQRHFVAHDDDVVW